MNQATIDNIIRVNKEFYDKVGPDFDKTRQTSWKGWGSIIEIIKDHFGNNSFSLLDVACGNGRFLATLSGQPLFGLGIDSNDYLLDQAKKKFGDKAEFQNLDIINDLDLLSSRKFDVIVAFGITHHIPSKELRIKWFEKLSDLVSNNGLLIFTIWNYQVDEKFEANEQINSKIELEEGDYFLGWSDNKNAKRYFHKYSDKEIKEINQTLNKKGLKQTQKFKSDGKNGELNEYFVYGKFAV